MTCTDLELPIRKGWINALKYLHLTSEEFPITQHSIEVCKSLVHGFRSHGRQYLNPIVLSHYKLDLDELDIDDVKAKAANLIPDEFHHDPKEQDPNAGHYRNSILPCAIVVIWMKGNKPTTVRFPNLLDPVPDKCIAYAAAMVHDILKRLAKDRMIKIESRAKTEEEKREREQEKAAAKARGEDDIDGNEDPMRVLMEDHLYNLKVFKEVMGGDYHAWRAELFKDAAKRASIYKGGLDIEEKEQEKPRKWGRLTPALFAGELRLAKERKAALMSTSDSNARANSKSTAKPKALPPPPSKLQQVEEQPKVHLPSRCSSNNPGFLDTDEDNKTPSNKESDDGGVGCMSKAIKRKVRPANSDEESESGDETESGEEAREEEGIQGGAEAELGGLAKVKEPDSTSRIAAKQKSSPEETNTDDGHDLQADQDPLVSQEEPPVKKRRLDEPPALDAPASDEEAQEPPPLAVEGPPNVTSKAVPSLPLSDSPEDLPTVPKCLTHSSESTKDAPPDQEAMWLALKKHQKIKSEKRKHTVRKRKEEEMESKKNDAAWEELERKVKEGKPVKAKAKAKAAKTSQPCKKKAKT